MAGSGASAESVSSSSIGSLPSRSDELSRRSLSNSRARSSISSCGSTPPSIRNLLTSIPSNSVGVVALITNSNVPSRKLTSSRSAIRISSRNNSARVSSSVLPAIGLRMGVVDDDKAHKTSPSLNKTAPLARVPLTRSVPVFFANATICRISRRFSSSSDPFSAMSQLG